MNKKTLTYYLTVLLIVSVGFLNSCKKKSGMDNQGYPITPIPFTHVQVSDNFWLPRIEQNHNVTIPYAIDKLYETGRVRNFKIAAGLEKGDFQTQYPFDDTDVYKVIEGASYSLQIYPDKKLQARVDTLISYISRAQEPDGYLYTPRTIHEQHPNHKAVKWIGDKRWSNVEDLSHELYDAGHLYQAAVAHYRATGKRTLLNVALKNADLLCKTFGPNEEDKYPGHQVVEMGLVDLYRVTGKQKYLDLAKFFLNARQGGKKYNQSYKKVTQQRQAVGHAVRATYMYSGMADVAAITGDKDYVKAIDAIWNDVVKHKLYVTGGIGSQGANEGFGPSYQLPNMTAYNETCASIGNVFWNYRLFLMHGESKYVDVMERTMYNSLLSGISLSGNRFFYPNPLESMGQYDRSGWFAVACCPGNITRFIPSMPGYIYAKQGSRLYVNLYVQNKAHINLQGDSLNFSQQTRYPWDGDISMTVNPESQKEFEVALRIPGWAQNKPVPSLLYTYQKDLKQKYTLKVNGEMPDYKLRDGYAVIDRRWNPGDKIELSLPMPIRRVKANDQVKADQDKMALQRGPIMYSLEFADNNGHVLDRFINKDDQIKGNFNPDKLGGVYTLTGQAESVKKNKKGKKHIEKTKFTAIPYYSWDNRGPGEMEVWIPNNQKETIPLKPPSKASKATVTSSEVKNNLFAVNDQREPDNSNDNSIPYYHWWPQKDKTEWVQYSWDAPQKLSSTKVYWFDDRPNGGVRLPAGWSIEYKDGNSWKPVKNSGKYTITKDAYDSISFAPVRTTAVRLKVKLPKNASSGILEWKIE